MHSLLTRSIRLVIIGGLLCSTAPVFSANNEVTAEIEILSAIEVPGTIVIQKQREFSRLTLEMTALTQSPPDEIVQSPFHNTMSMAPFDPPPSLRDPIADTLGVQTPVSPIKAERPPYPLIARQQGWEGTVILRLEVLPDGTVGSTTLKQTSGHQLLDESAIRSIRQWQFIPAKDGEFSIRVFVDLPVTFNLNR
ncbi:MAG: TonB family protein [Nitrospirales bacterium]|nr:TonB family protein [Nitrospirales bacterium]